MATHVLDPVEHSAQRLPVAGAADEELLRLARREALALTPLELRAIAERIGRDPTRAEAHAFAIQWSEHCSYKSSRELLRKLPTQSSDVLVPVGEDAGVLRVATIDGVDYGVVVAHESHNHPSQVVPFEGAATGVGGILRDVLCMGAELIASADPLRFGVADPGTHAAYVAGSVVDGIAAYGNAVGVPNIAGDVYFHPSFDDNCLVNVVALGLVRADRIIHSRVPKGGSGYDLVLVGKATDASGFGGAAFASLTLDAAQAQSNKSAVQVPDPFLKNVIMRATYAACEEAWRHGFEVGLKDLGAGGILGSTCELCNAGGFGAAIDIDAVPQGVPDLPPFVIACAETQERMLWAVPPQFTPGLLAIYNQRFTLPDVSAGACAAVIGKVTAARRYVLTSHAREIANVPIEVLAGKVVAKRRAADPAAKQPSEPAFEVPDIGEALVRVLAHRDVCSRRPLIEHYDTVVRGATAIPSGYADAGVVLIKRGARAGVALSVDGNPRYGAISPRLAAAHAVVESARNVAAVGAQPIGLTDCLNCGDPTDPAAFRQLEDGIEGLAEAARALSVGRVVGEPLPFVSGNVSLYNESANGNAVAPSAIVACIGRVDDIARVVTMQLVESGDKLFLLGRRTSQLGGSVIAALHGAQNGSVPPVDYAEANASIRAVVDAIRSGVILAAHDVSDGGVLACVAEMCLGGAAEGRIGARLRPPNEWAPEVSATAALFGEAGGFVVEVAKRKLREFHELCKKHGAWTELLGETGGDVLAVDGLCGVALMELAAAWAAPLKDLFD